MQATVHVIGAGLAGLSAAVRLAQAGANVVVHEATAQAGGRCRSYYDHGVGMEIDNGNHLMLSGNRAAMAFLDLIGTRGGLGGPKRAEFPFVDLASGRRWTLRPNDGPLPWWIFSRARRVPDTRARDYLGVAKLLRAAPGATLGAAMRCTGTLFERLWRPFFLAALNTEPAEASAALAAALIRETLLAGGAACRPLIARDGLSAVLVEPAVAFLRARGATVRLEHNLHALLFKGRRVAALDFGTEKVALGAGDAVVLAVPAFMAKALVPDLTVPDAYRAIVNAHFAVTPPASFPPMIGVINGTVEWIFAFRNRLSVTISNADRLVGAPREGLAQMIWAEVAAIAGIAGALPPWQIVRERRATFASTPEQAGKRPAAATTWDNLVLAGDWTATGLPATIEGAIRSGERAAAIVGSGKAGRQPTQGA